MGEVMHQSTHLDGAKEKRHALFAVAGFLAQLAAGLWALVLWALALAVVFSLGYWGLMAIMTDRDAVISEWHAVVEFDFPGIESGTYPNGLPFVHTDLLSTKLLERALLDTQLAEQIAAEALRERLAIMPAAPGRSALVSQHRDRWERAEPAEWATLEQRFISDLIRQELAQARLVLQLDSESAPALLASIVEHWANYVTREAGLFNTKIPLYGAQLVESVAFADADPILIYDRYRTLFELLNQNIEALQAQPNIGRARSVTDGFSITDLSAQASELRDFGLERLSTPMLALGAASSSPEFVLTTLQQRYRALARERAVLLAKVEQVDAALDQYDFGVRADLAAVDAAMEQGWLQQLIELGGHAADAQFRQALSRERLDYALSAEALMTEKIRLQQLIEAIELTARQSSNAGLGIDHEAEVKQAMAEMEQGLVRLFMASEELAGAVDALRYGGGGTIYRINVFDRPVSEPRLLTPEAVSRYWRLLLLVILLGTLLALSRAAFGRLRHA